MRALLGADRLASYAYQGMQIVCDEVLFGWLDPAHYGSITQGEYSRLRQYLPGGATHARGLFGWESAALDSGLFPRTGRYLVGAAGGGRELRALASRGLEVLGFEPNPVLFEGARAVADSMSNVRVARGSYADLVRAVRHRDGPLTCILDGAGFDAVILGWGSLTHVVDDAERTELLLAIRRLAPRAPVLASFYMSPERSAVAQGRSETLRRWVRRVVRGMGAPYGPSQGLGFMLNGGFVYTFTEPEIEALAFKTGYRVQRLDDSGFPHAVLMPGDPVDGVGDALR